MSYAKNIFEEALKAEGVTGPLADLARSVYHQESGSGSNTKTSNAGAYGGMQIIPGTFNSVADKEWDIKNPMHNAQAGIRYLKQLDKQSGGNPVLTAAGYYGGPGGLEKARKGIAVSDPRNPNAPNTLQYGQQVAARLGKQQPQPQMKQPSVLALPDSAVPANIPVDVMNAAAAVAPQVQVPEPEQVAQAGPNAWVAFKQAQQENFAQSQTVVPVPTVDLQHGLVNPMIGINPLPQQQRPVLLPPVVPNLTAFKAWGSKQRA